MGQSRGRWKPRRAMLPRNRHVFLRVYEWPHECYKCHHRNMVVACRLEAARPEGGVAARGAYPPPSGRGIGFGHELVVRDCAHDDPMKDVAMQHGILFDALRNRSYTLGKTCEQCNTLQGDSFLFEELTSMSAVSLRNKCVLDVLVSREDVLERERKSKAGEGAPAEKRKEPAASDDGAAAATDAAAVDDPAASGGTGTGKRKGKGKAQSQHDRGRVFMAQVKSALSAARYRRFKELISAARSLGSDEVLGAVADIFTVEQRPLVREFCCFLPSVHRARVRAWLDGARPITPPPRTHAPHTLSPLRAAMSPMSSKRARTTPPAAEASPVLPPPRRKARAAQQQQEPQASAAQQQQEPQASAAQQQQQDEPQASAAQQHLAVPQHVPPQRHLAVPQAQRVPSRPMAQQPQRQRVRSPEDELASAARPAPAVEVADVLLRASEAMKVMDPKIAESLLEMARGTLHAPAEPTPARPAQPAMLSVRTTSRSLPASVLGRGKVTARKKNKNKRAYDLVNGAPRDESTPTRCRAQARPRATAAKDTRAAAAATAPAGTMCVICLQRAVPPMSAPCGHIACRECWKQWLDMVLECPACRRRTRVSKLTELRLAGPVFHH